VADARSVTRGDACVDDGAAVRDDGAAEQRPEAAEGHYGTTLVDLRRLEEAKVLMRKVIPVALRVLGENNDTMLRMRSVYAQALYIDASATLDDLHESVKTYEHAARIARRVMGGAHPLVGSIEKDLRNVRAVLRARETPSTSN